MQQNSKCRLCGDRDETINHIISECSKLAQKENKSKHYWVGKVVHWEMCKKFKFDHTNKWFMHNPAPVLENDTNKLLWDFDVQTDHLISAGILHLIIINNKKREFRKLSTLLFRLTTEYNWKDMKRRISTSTLLGNRKKLWNMQVTSIPIVIGAFGTVKKGLLKGLEDLEVGGREETIQTNTLFWTARILRRVLETWGHLLLLKPSANADMKNSNE